MSRLRLVPPKESPPPGGVDDVVPAEPAAPRAAVPQHIRDRLSPVVLDVYSSGDFHRADMRSLAKEAGMSFATIYRHFGDKEALLFWFINDWFRDLYPYAVQPLTDGWPLREALFECLRRHMEFYDKHPKVGRIVFMTVPLDRWMRDESYHQHEVMRTLLQAMAAGQARGELRPDVSPVAMLDAFTGLFNRSFLMWEYRRRKAPLVEKAQETFNLLWGGIGAQDAALAAPRAPAAAAKRPSKPSTKAATKATTKQPSTADGPTRPRSRK